jgi:hypothetical protein
MNRSLIIAEFYVQTNFCISPPDTKGKKEYIKKLSPIYIATSHFEQSGAPKYDINRQL